MGAAVALVFLAAGPGGCAMPEELTGESGMPAALGPDGADSGAAGEDAVSDEATPLERVAAGLASGAGNPEVAWSEGYTSISISNDYRRPPEVPSGYNPHRQGDLGRGGAGDSGETDGSGEAGDSGGSGDSGGRGDSAGSDGSIEEADEEPCENFYPEQCYTCHTWGGDYEGIIYCRESDTLEGYPDGAKDMKFCSASMSFDDAGVPEWIPLPIFARTMTRVGVRFVGETRTYSYWVYHVTVTVVSASYTPTTADVVLEIELSQVGEYASIWATGVHTMHTEIVGDSVVYSSQTQYDGSFFAAEGDPDNPGEDWEADATQDFDCTATLRKP